MLKVNFWFEFSRLGDRWLVRIDSKDSKVFDVVEKEFEGYIIDKFPTTGESRDIFLSPLVTEEDIERVRSLVVPEEDIEAIIRRQASAR